MEFWKQLAALKLNILRLSEEAVPITGALIPNVTEPAPWCGRMPAAVPTLPTVLTAVGHAWPPLELPCACSWSSALCSCFKPAVCIRGSTLSSACMCRHVHSRHLRAGGLPCTARCCLLQLQQPVPPGMRQLSALGSLTLPCQLTSTWPVWLSGYDWPARTSPSLLTCHPRSTQEAARITLKFQHKNLDTTAKPASPWPPSRLPLCAKTSPQWC